MLPKRKIKSITFIKHSIISNSIKVYHYIIILTLYKNLYSIFFSSEKSVTFNLNVVIGITNKLRDLGNPMNPNQVIGKIISSLPEEYARVRSSWQDRPVAERTLATLQSKLITEELIVASYKEKLAAANAGAFYATGYYLT